MGKNAKRHIQLILHFVDFFIFRLIIQYNYMIKITY